MKTIIFLGQRQAKHFNFTRFYDPERYRFVTILNQTHHPLLAESAKPYFAKVYKVSDVAAEDALKAFELDYDEVAEIVAQEVELVGGPEHVQIMCNDEFNMLVAAKLRDQFNIQGPGHDVMLGYRNKVIMKDRLRAAGIRVPKYMKVDLMGNDHDLSKTYAGIVAELGNHFVIKPFEGGGSIATAEIQTEQEFIDFIAANSENYRYEVEEYIKGTLMHCDSLVCNGEVVFSAVSEYLFPNLEFVHGKNLVSMPIHVDDPRSDRIKEMSEQVLSVLGMYDMATHMEVFITEDGELVFLEVAARFPGAFVLHCYKATYDLSMADGLLHILLEGRLDYVSELPSQYALVAILPLQEGTIKAIQQPQLRSQHDEYWFAKPGDEIRKGPQSLFDAAGRLFLTNSNYDELRQDFEYLRSYRALIME